MRKKILSLIIATGLVMSMSMPILAAPLTEKLNDQKKQLLEQQSSYTKLQKDYEKLELSIEMLDFDIETLYTGIDKSKGEINVTESKIHQTTKDITIAESNIKGEEDLFNQRMRVMFMNGADTYLEIILNSKGFEDFISRVENVKKIVDYDNKIISDLNAKKQEIVQRKVSLNESKSKILALQIDNKNKLDKLSSKKQEQSKVIVESQKQKKLNETEIAQIEASMGSTISQIKDEANQAARYELAIATKKTQEITLSRGSVSNEVRNETKAAPIKEAVNEVRQPQKPSTVSSNAVVAYAQSFMGTPYEYGAEGPNTFDCSGFTQYVYRHFGVNLGRATFNQINDGVYVARENLQAGDLVFFGSGSPHHMGIYVGNGSYIHAPHTGDVVKISRLTRTDYMSARRVR